MSWQGSSSWRYDFGINPRFSCLTGEYQDFLTGFVTSEDAVWGRPVGVTVAHDGSLMVTDDGSNSVWRVSYTGK